MHDFTWRMDMGMKRSGVIEDHTFQFCVGRADSSINSDELIQMISFPVSLPFLVELRLFHAQLLA